MARAAAQRAAGVASGRCNGEWPSGGPAAGAAAAAAAGVKGPERVTRLRVQRGHRLYCGGIALAMATSLAAAACRGRTPDGSVPPASPAGPGGGREAERGAPVRGAAAAGVEIVRTGDPYRRGYTDADFPRLQQLADGVYTWEALRSAGDEKFTTVSLFVVTDAGVLVADGQGSVAETARLVEAIGRVTDKPITHVVVCSDHGDHTGGNSAFPRSTTFIAHPTSRAALVTAALNLNRPVDAPAIPLPSVLVEDRMSLTLGGRTIDILFLGRAHTGGDLLVHLPVEKILFTSEAYLNRIFPAMRSAYPTEWVEVLAKAQAMDIDVYVPGHGFVESAPILEEELARYRLAVEQVIAEAKRLHASGATVEQAIERARFGDLETWTLRSSQGPIAIRRIYAELNGALR